MRVLLVEDDGMIAQGLQTALRQGNYAVDWVADGKSADAALRDSVFDLVLLDLGLPQRDGLGVLRAMRQRGGATPVIILTSFDRRSPRCACSFSCWIAHPTTRPAARRETAWVRRSNAPFTWSSSC